VFSKAWESKSKIQEGEVVQKFNDSIQ